jgi:adenylyltransferase/sulfurtransferase
MISSNILSSSELRRFGKQISLPQIGLEGQENIKKAKVAVIGAGGLGTVVLQYLAASGVGSIGIIDYALVEETNIHRQTLYGGNDLGKLKTIICKQNLQNLFPLIKIEIINLQLTSRNIDTILRPFDMVVDATNDPISSKIICNSCNSLKLPWIFGSLNNFEGRVAVIDFKKGFICNDADILDNKIPHGEKKTGAISLAYGFLGNLMTLEIIKFLVKSPDTLCNKVLSCNMLSYTFTVSDLYPER